MNPEQRQQLIKAALHVRSNAYTPYSGYKVGAALLSSDGHIITGCNVENAAYGPTICAEQTAVVKAISEGWQQFIAIAIATSNAGFPCGICRQVLYEFSPDLWVIIVDSEGLVHAELSLNDLLPHGFNLFSSNS